MEKIILRNEKNKKMNPDLVRYFRCQNDDYLIYTFHEKDEKDFIKLYVVKVMEELGKPVARTLSTDWEWEKLQMIVKQMLKELKHGEKENFQNLEIDSIWDMKIASARSFKLSEPLVEILSGDKVIEKKVLPKMEKKEETKPKEEIPMPTKVEHPPIQTSDVKPVLPKKELPTEPTPTSHTVVTPKMNPMPSKEANMERELRDKIAMQKLQQENELLKKQLVQYRVKYQALKDLLTKDE